MNVKDLERLGFTNHVSRVYVALYNNKKGMLSTIEIVKEANVSPTKVYEMLRTLKKSGLVEKISAIKYKKSISENRKESIKEILKLANRRNIYVRIMGYKGIKHYFKAKSLKKVIIKKKEMLEKEMNYLNKLSKKIKNSD